MRTMRTILERDVPGAQAIECATGRVADRSAGLARAQRGGALLVSMIMIFMLSIMGVSAMRGSTLERQMAANSIQSHEVFQAAESATEIALNNPQNLSDAFLDNDGRVELDAPIRDNIGLEASVELDYVGEGLAPGFSLDVFSALRFIAAGDAQIEAVRARSIVEQGAFRVVPAN